MEFITCKEAYSKHVMLNRTVQLCQIAALPLKQLYNFKWLDLVIIFLND